MPLQNIQTMPYDQTGMGFGPMGQNQTPWGLKYAVDPSAANAATQQSAAAEAISLQNKNRLLELAEAAGQRKQNFYNSEMAALEEQRKKALKNMQGANVGKEAGIGAAIGTLALGPVGTFVGGAAGASHALQSDAGSIASIQSDYNKRLAELAAQYGY